MAGASPQPLCVHTQPIRVKDGTSMLHSAHTPGAQGGPCVVRPNCVLQAVVFDGVMMHRLFRSTAYAIAVARHIQLKAMQANANDPLGVKFFIAVLPDRYLTREVDLPGDAQLDQETAATTEEFGKIFWQELEERGVQGAITFLEDVEAQRENALEKVKQVYKDAAAFNQAASESQETFRHGLTIVKCTSTIIVAGLTLPVIAGAAAGAGIAAGAGSLAFFGVGAAYSITLNVVKDWDKASSADLVLVAAQKGASKSQDKIIKNAAKGMSKIYQNESDTSAPEKAIEWMSKRLGPNASPKYGSPAYQARLLRRIARADQAAQVAKNAGRIATALKAVPYLFFAWSAGSAIKTAHDEW